MFSSRCGSWLEKSIKCNSSFFQSSSLLGLSNCCITSHKIQGCVCSNAGGRMHLTHSGVCVRTYMCIGQQSMFMHFEVMGSQDQHGHDIFSDACINYRNW